MKYFQIHKPEELDVLKSQKASFENLNFAFSDDYLQSLKELLSLKNPYQLIAKSNGDFAGYIASSEREYKPNYLWLTELFINSKFQGKGLGSELVSKAIDFARKQNLEGVVTQTEFENIPAQKLYEKFGLKQIENPDWKEGITYELKF